MRPKDILPDEVNQTEIAGTTVRKGTVGAFIANAKIIQAASTTSEDRQAAERDLMELLPAVRALGIFDVFEVRDAGIRALVERGRQR